MPKLPDLVLFRCAERDFRDRCAGVLECPRELSCLGSGILIISTFDFREQNSLSSGGNERERCDIKKSFLQELARDGTGSGSTYRARNCSFERRERSEHAAGSVSHWRQAELNSDDDDERAF